MSLLPALLCARICAAPPTLAPEERYATEIDAALLSTRAIFAVPRELVLAVIRQESAFNPNAVSKAGAVGLMQIMPPTAQKLGIRSDSLGEPATNILAGVRLLAHLLDYYHGDLISVLVAYNARPRELYAPIPLNGETPQYVTLVLHRYFEYRASLRKPTKETPR